MDGRPGALDGDDARARLYDVLGADEPLAERLERALAVGVAYFGVDRGYVVEIDETANEWEILVSTDSAGAGATPGDAEDLTSTYCRRTIEDEGVLALSNAPEQGWADDVAFQRSGQHCYHGAPIVVEGETYGTVCFAAAEPRADPFDEAEKSFTHLLAQMAGYQIEQERHEAELAARERELDERQEVYRAVVDASFDLVFRADRSGRFMTHLSPVEEVLGYDTETLVGRQVTDVIANPEATARATELLNRVLAGEKAEELALPMETKTGDRIYADIRATPIYRSDVPIPERSPEDVVAVQGMAREATERQRREGLIRVLNRVLRHNLRNDVNVIRGLAELLDEDLTGEAVDHAERIIDTTDRLIGLSETARKLEESFETTPTLDPLDVVPIVERLAARIEEEYPGADLSLDVPDSAVAASAPRLETALWELLDNAGQHAGDAPSIEVTVTTSDHGILVRIVDDGPGLPAQEQAVLTDGDETPLVHGSGLGLWLVYWLVTGIDGDLTVCAGDDGACIQMSLPAADT